MQSMRFFIKRIIRLCWVLVGSFIVAYGLSSYDAWAQKLQCVGLVAPQHVGS